MWSGTQLCKVPSRVVTDKDVVYPRAWEDMPSDGTKCRFPHGYLYNVTSSLTLCVKTKFSTDEL